MTLGRFKIRPSTIAAAVSWMLSAFTALPTWHNFMIQLANAGVLGLVIWLAHHDGRNSIEVK